MTPKGIIAVLLLVVIVFAAPITVVQSLLAASKADYAVFEGVRNVGQGLQGLATVAALAIGGYWTYIVFVHGRQYTAHVSISTEFKRVIKVGSGTHAAVIAVKLKNGGRARIEMERCRAGIKYFDDEDLGPLTETLIRTSLVAFSGNWEDIFRNVEGLEPGEEKTEDILLNVEVPRWFEVGVQFTGHVRGGFAMFADTQPIRSSSRMFLDVGAHTRISLPASFQRPTGAG
jgi:hypothetical protein